MMVSKNHSTFPACLTSLSHLDRIFSLFSQKNAATPAEALKEEAKEEEKEKSDDDMVRSLSVVLIDQC
jgi:hypothetical protein